MFDRYHLEHELGAGARGVVYRARDRETGRRVAIKLVAEGDAPDEPEASLRAWRGDVSPFHSALLDLRHPDIAALYATGRRGLLRYVVMECAEGRDLRAHTEIPDLLPLAAVLRLAARVARALEHAHARGIVHGDVKPANIVYDAATGALKLTDFALDGPDAPGAPAFASPERLCGAPANPASDQYALGATLYQLACGALPFGGRTRADAARHALAGAPPDPRRHRPALPGGWAAVIQRALAPAPAARFPSAAGLAQAFDALAAVEAQAA